MLYVPDRFGNNAPGIRVLRGMMLKVFGTRVTVHEDNHHCYRATCNTSASLHDDIANVQITDDPTQLLNYAVRRGITAAEVAQAEEMKMYLPKSERRALGLLK
jgi:hypothetical protein